MATAIADRELIADGLLTVQETLDFTKLSRTDLYARMNSGELRSIKIGRRRLIPKRALIDLLSRNLVSGVAAEGEGA